MTTTPNTTGPVVVTGAAGFIGSHLTDALLALGVEVIAIDRGSVPSRINAKADISTLATGGRPMQLPISANPH
jgi:UDP-glucose 4-epimerase